MSVKIFCNSCQEFIKNAEKKDIKNLTGDEICEKCEVKIRNLYTEVDTISRRGIVALERQRDVIKAELERAWKKVIKADEQA